MFILVLETNILISDTLVMDNIKDYSFYLYATIDSSHQVSSFFFHSIILLLLLYSLIDSIRHFYSKSFTVILTIELVELKSFKL